MEEAAVPTRTHDPPNVNVPAVALVVSEKVPVGVMNIPGDVSVTVTLQVEAEPAVTGLVQLMVVVVARLLTTTLPGPLLVL